MPQTQCWVLRAVRLPATTRQHLAARFDFKQTPFVSGGIARAKSSGPEIRGQSLHVALSEKARGNERFLLEFGSYLGEERRRVSFIAGVGEVGNHLGMVSESAKMSIFEWGHLIDSDR